MYNEKDINDSLEFCKDIDVYYEKKDKLTAYEAYKKGKVPKKGFSSRYSTQRRSSHRDISFGSLSDRNSETAVSSIEVDEEEKEGLFSRILGNIGAFIVILFLAYGISSFLTNYCIWHTQVDGISMNPALEDDDRLIIDKLSYRFREPERFDIIVFPQSLDVYYVKRIIGLPGETVNIADGKIYVDDVVLVENYGNEPIDEGYSMEEPVTLGEGEYFVLGDNRNHSVDSRDSSVGVVTRNHIIGKALVLLYPFNHFKFF